MIFETIRTMVAEQFGTPEESITMETQFVEDLGADSLDIVELSMALEEEYDVGELSEDEIKSIHTVGDVVEFIQKKVEG